MSRKITFLYIISPVPSLKHNYKTQCIVRITNRLSPVVLYTMRKIFQPSLDIHLFEDIPKLADMESRST
jgi:hypothetical protein